MPVPRRTLLKGLGASAAVACGPEEFWYPPEDKPRPKGIILAFPDQLRSPALEIGAPPLPNLEALKRAGIDFPNHFTASPLCAPARASLLTGLLPMRHGLWDNFRPLSYAFETLGDRFSREGWATGWVGKWHLGDVNVEPRGWVPPMDRRGFQWWAAHNFTHDYLDPVYYRDEPVRIRPGTFEPPHQTELALEFVDSAGDRPFLLVLSWGPPHSSAGMPEQWPQVLPPGMLDRVDPYAIGFRGNVPEDMQETPVEGARHQLWGYYAASLAIDDALGQLMDGLRDRGLLDDVLLVLSSDHGEMGASHGRYAKGLPYEEATRVPLVFHWPRGLTPRTVGLPATLTDLGPTFLGLAGLGEWDVDGMDLSPHLLGDPDAPDRETVLIQSDMVRRWTFDVVHDGRMKYTWFEDSEKEYLVDLDVDPYELSHVTDDPEYAEDLAWFRHQYKSWLGT